MALHNKPKTPALMPLPLSYFENYNNWLVVAPEKSGKTTLLNNLIMAFYHGQKGKKGQHILNYDARSKYTMFNADAANWAIRANNNSNVVMMLDNCFAYNFHYTNSALDAFLNIAFRPQCEPQPRGCVLYAMTPPSTTSTTNTLRQAPCGMPTSFASAFTFVALNGPIAPAVLKHYFDFFCVFYEKSLTFDVFTGWFEEATKKKDGWLVVCPYGGGVYSYTSGMNGDDDSTV